jgi:hypothetical protein
MGIGMFGMAMSLPDLGFQSGGAAPTPGGSLSVGTTGGGKDVFKTCMGR